MTQLMTAEQLETVDVPGKWTELVRGHLIVREPPGTYHGEVAANLLILLGAFVKGRALGHVFSQDTGFKIESNPDTVRAPDLAFVNRERSDLIGRRGYSALVPNLVAEVLSPDDRAAEVLEKVAQWLDAGVEIVWVVDPDRHEVRVHRGDGTLTVLSRNDRLDGEAVLPGFSCGIAEIF